MYLERLERQGALPRLNPESLGKFRLLKLKEAFLQSPPQGMAPRLVGQLQGDFSLLISLYHAYELLLAHGLRPFFHFLKGELRRCARRVFPTCVFTASSKAVPRLPSNVTQVSRCCLPRSWRGSNNVADARSAVGRLLASQADA